MTYEEKIEKFDKKIRNSFEKTPFQEIPCKFQQGSSSHAPDQKEGMSTCDIVLWVKWKNFDWFRPYGGFGQLQIIKMIEICDNDYEIESLFELLSAKRVPITQN